MDCCQLFLPVVTRGLMTCSPTRQLNISAMFLDISSSFGVTLVPLWVSDHVACKPDEIGLEHLRWKQNMLWQRSVKPNKSCVSWIWTCLQHDESDWLLDYSNAWWHIVVFPVSMEATPIMKSKWHVMLPDSYSVRNSSVHQHNRSFPLSRLLFLFLLLQSERHLPTIRLCCSHGFVTYWSQQVWQQCVHHACIYLSVSCVLFYNAQLEN